MSELRLFRCLPDEGPEFTDRVVAKQGRLLPFVGLVRLERRRDRPSRCFEEKPFPSGAHNLFHILLPLWRISPAGLQQLDAI
jgi:hypothetical protein